MRERRINLLKGIGLFFVCFGHIGPGVVLEKHVYSFHMPLFSSYQVHNKWIMRYTTLFRKIIFP